MKLPFSRMFTLVCLLVLVLVVLGHANFAAALDFSAMVPTDEPINFAAIVDFESPAATLYNVAAEACECDPCDCTDRSKCEAGQCDNLEFEPLAMLYEAEAEATRACATDACANGECHVNAQTAQRTYRYATTYRTSDGGAVTYYRGQPLRNSARWWLFEGKPVRKLAMAPFRLAGRMLFGRCR